MSRTYADAITCLNTLQSNFAVVDAVRRSGGGMNKQAIPEMIDWCQKTGYMPSQFNSLNLVHIAGTKGKGSTSAFISSILTQFIGTTSRSNADGRPISKIGLYTSPHLRFVRERIRINNKPLTEEEFAYYFFQTWDRLEAAAAAAGLDPQDPSTKPAYFRFLTLMAFHTYASEGVDAAVIECGLGGEYDSTNILTQPVVTGITSLGVDHTAILGGTIEEIAWHKAGIMKPGAKCFTCTGQKESAMKVLQERAREKGAELHVVEVDADIRSGRTKLGLQADFQKINAGLAAAIAQEWLRQNGVDVDSESTREKIRKGLSEVQWGGRCETRREAGITWYIDGGHTLESIELTGQWFAEQVRGQSSSTEEARRVLIFNQQTRDASALARGLHDTLSTAIRDGKPFTHAIFCTNTTFKETGFRPDLVSINTSSSEVQELRVQNGLAATWTERDPSTHVKVVPTIEEAVAFVRALAHPSNGAGDVTVLVTGSLHLALFIFAPGALVAIILRLTCFCRLMNKAEQTEELDA